MNFPEITLLHGDSLTLLCDVPPDTLDLIFADPPFNIGKKYGGKADTDNRPDYEEWCAAWIAAGFRALKPTGTFCLMTISRHVFRIGTEMGRHGIFINKVEWRNVSAAHGKRSFWPSTQPILLFGKTSAYQFFPYAQRKKPALARWGDHSTYAQGMVPDYWNDIPFVYAGSIQHPEAILTPGTNRKAHPAQMPVALAARCIVFFTAPGDLVCDPFSGSGTTGEACLRLQRRFLGMEREADYCALAEQRWAAVRQQPDLLPELAAWQPSRANHGNGGQTAAWRGLFDDDTTD